MSQSTHLDAYVSTTPAAQASTLKPFRSQPKYEADPELAYLKFFALALQSSLNELRCSAANKVLLFEVLDGLDLLTDNLRKRFGFLTPPPNHPIAALRPNAPSQQLRLQTTVGEEKTQGREHEQSPTQP